MVYILHIKNQKLLFECLNIKNRRIPETILPRKHEVSSYDSVSSASKRTRKVWVFSLHERTGSKKSTFPAKTLPDSSGSYKVLCWKGRFFLIDIVSGSERTYTFQIVYVSMFYTTVNVFIVPTAHDSRHTHIYIYIYIEYWQ